MNPSSRLVAKFKEGVGWWCEFCDTPIHFKVHYLDLSRSNPYRHPVGACRCLGRVWTHLPGERPSSYVRPEREKGEPKV